MNSIVVTYDASQLKACELFCKYFLEKRHAKKYAR